MEIVTRTPYQGVFNIIRFNWHFYVIAALFVIALLFIGYLLDEMFWLCFVVAVGTILTTFVSLFVSYYVYDRSELYGFRWLQQFDKFKVENIVNIHAGFDETSDILKLHFPQANLRVFDFYDRTKHTEVSIERARKAYPPFEGTVKITTDQLPVDARSVDIIFNIFALHEVRERNERIQFLKEQVVGLKNNGNIVIVEHLRDLPNFLAYNIGFMHFFSDTEWKNNFKEAGLFVENEFKITPFISVFILRKDNGNTP